MTDTTIATINKSPIEVLRERFIVRRTELKNALPSDIDPDHFIRAVVTSAQINPDILAASFQSVWLACMRACRDGLLPDGVEGAIVPFKSTATWIPMYRGLLKKFRQSGQCKWVGADVVRTDEIFEHYVDETGEHFRHVPGDNDAAAIIKIYAAALTKDGAFYCAVMSMSEVDKIRRMSRATREDAPWNMWPQEMQKKTALRRLAKLLPSGREITGDEDDLPSFGYTESPSLTPLPSPQQEEPRRPQGAAASLDQFAGSTAASAEQPPTQPADQGGDGDVTSTVAANPSDESADTLDHLAEADGDPIRAAYDRGKKAKRDGLARKAMPGEYRDPAHSRESIAWQSGFDDKPMPTWG